MSDEKSVQTVHSHLECDEMFGSVSVSEDEESICESWIQLKETLDDVKDYINMTAKTAEEKNTWEKTLLEAWKAGARIKDHVMNMAILAKRRKRRKSRHLEQINES